MRFPVFSDPGDFRTSLREDGDVDLVVTGAGEFRARMSRISLFNMRLVACEEHLSRIAFISIPPGLVRVTLPPRPTGSLIWNGVVATPREIVTHGAGYRFHERTAIPSRWSTIWLRAKDLVDVGRATHRSAFMLPHREHRWRPESDALKALVSLHESAIRATAIRPKLSIEADAARGLEQQMVMTLIECLNGQYVDYETASARRHVDLMVRLADVVRGSAGETLSVAGLAVTLGISKTVLWRCCHAHLGISPGRYLHLRRIRQVRGARRNPLPT